MEGSNTRATRTTQLFPYRTVFRSEEKGGNGRLRRKAAGKRDREIAFSSRRAGGERRREDMARIGFIGLGNMGGGMAANLAKKGHDVHAFDLSQDALDRAKKEGCLPVGSAKDRKSTRLNSSH